jgi:DNA-binding MurR/RpiR family transcriptional regulator
MAKIKKENSIHTYKYQARIEKRLSGLSAAEQAVASHLAAHPEQLPFETADSLSKRLSVSAMTVGRTLRALGYKGLAQLRTEMCAEVSEVAPWSRRGLSKPPAKMKSLDRARALKAELEAVEAVHALAETPEWQRAVKLIARADKVFVAGFHTERGLATVFSDNLAYVRSGVQNFSIENRAYADLRTDASSKSCVVMIDCRRYSRWFRMLGEKTSSLGIPLVIATDVYCSWASKLTPCVLPVRTDSGRFWANHAPLASLLNLLIEDVIEHLGDAMYTRLDAATEFGSAFVGFERVHRQRNKNRKRQGRTILPSV